MDWPSREIVEIQAIGRGSDDVLGALTGTDDWFSIDVSQNDQVSLTVDVPDDAFVEVPK